MKQGFGQNVHFWYYFINQDFLKIAILISDHFFSSKNIENHIYHSWKSIILWRIKWIFSYFCQNGWSKTLLKLRQILACYDPTQRPYPLSFYFCWLKKVCLVLFVDTLLTLTGFSVTFIVHNCGASLIKQSRSLEIQSWASQ